jgi:hypothetical protein
VPSGRACSGKRERSFWIRAHVPRRSILWR